MKPTLQHMGLMTLLGSMACGQQTPPPPPSASSSGAASSGPLAASMERSSSSVAAASSACAGGPGSGVGCMGSGSTAGPPSSGPGQTGSSTANPSSAATSLFPTDAGAPDALGARDAGPADAGAGDAGAPDAGGPTDSGSVADVGSSDDGGVVGAVSVCTPVGQPAQLCKDAQPWRPRGFSLVAAAGSPASNALAVGSVWEKAQTNLLNPSKRERMFETFRGWGVDALRLQVSQEGLDPQQPLYDPTYAPLVLAMVQNARAAGFPVLVSMRASLPGNEPELCVAEMLEAGLPTHLPCSVTQRAWLELLALPSLAQSALGKDPGVVLEIFNEPLAGEANTPAMWSAWHQTHQPLVTYLRGMGAENTFIADGIRAGKFAPLPQVPALVDPLGPVVIGIHPYPLYIPNQRPFSYYRVEEDLEPAFGAYCRGAGHVCLATEWGASSESACYAPYPGEPIGPDGGVLLGLDTPDLVYAFTSFLADLNVGMFVWPGDYPGNVIRDYRYDAATSLTDFGPIEDFACSTSTRLFLGMGNLVKTFYQTGTVPPVH